MKTMRRVGWGLILGSLFCVRAAAAQPAAKAASPAIASSAGPASADAAARAEVLYERGRKEAIAGEWQKAFTTQRAAYAWYRHWRIAGALGDAAFVVGEYPTVTATLPHYLREAPNLTPQERSDTEKRLAEATKNCGALAIEAPTGPPGAEVKVDGASVGRVPLRGTVYVLPGAHTVEVAAGAAGAGAGAVTGVAAGTGAGTRAAAGAGAGAAAGTGAAADTGAAARKQTVIVTAGGTVSVTVNAGAAPAGTVQWSAVTRRTGGTTRAPAGAGVEAAGSQAPSPWGMAPGAPTGEAIPQPPAGEKKPSVAPVVVLGTAAGLGLVVGSVLMGISVAKENEAAEKLKDVEDAPRPCLTAPCMKIDGLLAERDALGSAALGVWVGSASFAALAAGIYIVQQRTRTHSAMTWTPVVSTNGAGLVVRGAF